MPTPHHANPKNKTADKVMKFFNKPAIKHTLPAITAALLCASAVFARNPEGFDEGVDSLEVVKRVSDDNNSSTHANDTAMPADAYATPTNGNATVKDAPELGKATARSAFEVMPAEVFSLILPDVKLDLLDYYDSGVTPPRNNKKFATLGPIDTITPNLLSIQLTPQRKADIVILPRKKDSIIMLIDRMGSTDVDSRISFYDTKWNPLDAAKIFSEPLLADWLKTNEPDQRLLVENALPFMMYNAIYNPETQRLTLNRNVGSILAIEDASTVNSALRPSLTYIWTGEAFKQAK